MTDISSLGKLIQEGKLDESRALLVEAVNTPLSDVERGQAIVTLVLAYMQTKNTINQALLADIKETLRILKSVSSDENVLKDGVKLAKVREKLA